VANDECGRCGTDGQCRSVERISRKRQNNTVPSSQSSQDVAHDGLWQSMELSGSKQTCRDGDINGCQDVADTPQRQNDRRERTGMANTERQKGRVNTAVDSGCEDGCPNCEGEPESRLGRTLDGLPKRLDGYWNDGWEDGTPRTTESRANRANRLRALGNSIIPQVAYEIMKGMLLA